MATPQLLLVSLTLLVAQPATRQASPTASETPDIASDAAGEESFDAGFLDAADLAEHGLRRDRADMDLEESNPSFAEANGLRKGMVLWTASEPGSALDTLVDVRWSFPSTAAAATFIASSSADLLFDGLPPIHRDADIGTGGQLHGQSSTTSEIGGTRHVLVFRVGRIVVKIYLESGADPSTDSLSPDIILALGRQVADRLGTATTLGPQPPPPDRSDSPAPATSADPPTVGSAPVERDPEAGARERVREYRTRSSFEPSLHPGAAFSAPIGDYEWRGHAIRQRTAWSIELSALVHPRVHLRAQFHRERWRGPPGFNVITRRLEFMYGLDLLALPPSWKVRPALLGIGGLGFGWSYAGLPEDQATLFVASADSGVGLGLVFGGEAGVHFRVTPQFDLAIRGGVMRAFYTYTDDHAAGGKGYPRAWRWHAGVSFGFILPRRPASVR